MIRRPPRSAPFPYTTLSQSLNLPDQADGHRAEWLGLTAAWHIKYRQDLDSGRDRKSTRLNSSHSQISYAVFCLKKKKQRNEPVEVKRGFRTQCSTLLMCHRF